MKIAITGATGFVGSRLVVKLYDRGDDILILTRNPDKARRIYPKSIYPKIEIIPYIATESGDWQKEICGCDAVINLAGEPISERWTGEAKRAIVASREIGTEKIVEAISRSERVATALADQKPKVLINSSAIGYYGTSETASFDENSPPGDDFLADVCKKWETAAQKVKDYGTRLVILRTGIVLGNGGALGKMIPPFKLFAGGPIGSGRQWFSWIHRDDLINLIIYCLDRQGISGTFNATAPNPVRMKEFCQILGEVMNRPSWLPVPDFALEILLGEGAKIVLEGQEVLPKATQALGFDYRYPNLEAALQEIVPKM
ncbi:epimerase family protein [Microcystis aeruginosa NIES-2520]|uniref:Epimerase family protein n=1 Tax=Microcystis aeruginosa NIES-2520 TaxID=2303982 RepID=A0A5A5RR57_MICAE|nr:MULTISPECIES: TIGR01777 family oxidoreductase [Microcystis]MCA2813194.1 TIGR01777 family protein [Microcystis sp. M090S1]NCR77222.1 TIGR01777 family protein [Microcystis aeruginosa K13-06]GCA77465.1 epimerase family protein [Microcystis aeruginosa NIES-2520]